MPELMAIPLVLGGLAILFIILFAGDVGVGAWIAVGVIAVVAIVAAIAILLRRPRPIAALQGSEPFAGAPRVSDGAHRVLLVVDGVCSDDDLGQIAAGGGRTVAHVVAPAASSRLDRLTGDEQAYQRAGDRVEATLEALRGLEIEATGDVGSHDPLQAADESLRTFPADEIVFVLDGETDAAWLEEGVVDAARERYSVPVRAVTAAGG
jgi:hypothetical protein